MATGTATIKKIHLLKYFANILHSILLILKVLLHYSYIFADKTTKLMWLCH